MDQSHDEEIELVQQIEKQYQRLFRDTRGTLLKSEALHCRLQFAPIRSLAWMVFLGALEKNDSLENWIQTTRNEHSNYEMLVQKHNINPRNAGVEFNPLALDDNSPWKLFFEDEELRKVIMQDIDRCYPEYEFFQRDDVKEIMLMVLFIYAKEYPETRYKQGMHELLAPILYLLDQESVVPVSDDHVTALFNEENIEASSWFIFRHLMSYTNSWFEHSNTNKSKFSDIMERCDRIQNQLMRDSDPSLFTYLQGLDLTQVYLLRWIRIMFGRELNLEKTLILWDSIFAYGNNLVLVDYIAVTFHIVIRDLRICFYYVYYSNISST
eukprot:TRINITY_DN6306_c0_g1_i1.p1 TRINITY_DN6306_c0_g1~~TRINITY_DN6306_c0_g1_i1.p1  ORF type:complete len:324 (-),score=46.41 TRINITY_DN6306_c0_g1_i1:448-1419(-)